MKTKLKTKSIITVEEVNVTFTMDEYISLMRMLGRSGPTTLQPFCLTEQELITLDGIYRDFYESPEHNEYYHDYIVKAEGTFELL